MNKEKRGWFKKGIIPWNKGQKMNIEFVKKNSEGHKGQIPWNKGKKLFPLSEEHRRKLSEANKGKHYRKISEETKKKMSIAHKGKKHSEETRKKMGISNKGKTLGRILSEEHRRKISESRRGKNVGQNHPGWIKDRTKIKQYWTERNNSEYKQWRKQVWIRDNYKCRINNQDCSGKIIAHHILGWSEFPELRYKINNGITLCQHHHPIKKVDEKNLISFLKN